MTKSVNIPDDLHAEVFHVTEQIGCTVAKIVDHAVDDYIDDPIEVIIEKMKKKPESDVPYYLKDKA